MKIGYFKSIPYSNIILGVISLVLKQSDNNLFTDCVVPLN